MSRRAVLVRAPAAALAPRLGAQRQPSRFPYGSRPAQPGTGPASQGQVTHARQVIVAGPGGTPVGVYVYTPGATPGPGTRPVDTLSQSSDDPYGNVTLPGDTSYAITASPIVALQNNGAGLFWYYWTGSAWSGMFSTAIGDAGTAAETLGIENAAGNAGWQIGNSECLLLGSVGPLTAAGRLPAISGSGLAGYYPIIATDNTTNGPGNVTTAADVTLAWPVPSGDFASKTTYIIDTDLLLTAGTTAENISFGISVNGTNTTLVTIGSSAFTAGDSYVGPARLKLIAQASGADAYLVSLSGRLTLTTSSLTGVDLNSASTAVAWSAGANTLALFAQFAGAGGSAQLCNGRGSQFTACGV